MNKNKELSRFAERAGWSVTLVTFFCGTIFLLLQQEANHHQQMMDLFKQPQTLTPKIEKSKTISPYSSISVSSKVLPPAGSRIGHAFWVSEQLDVMSTEVTKELYSSIMFGTTGSDSPMLFTHIQDVFQFANALSSFQGLKQCYFNESLVQDCTGWRIPTDNEWMLFASAGQGTKYSGSDVFNDVGWSESQNYHVASKPPNSWGMHDMSGGSREIVFDHKESKYGLLGDESPLERMRIQSLDELFAVRLVRIAAKESQRN